MAESLAAEAFALTEVAGWSLTQVDCWAGSKSFVEEALANACGVAMPPLVGETAQLGGLLAIRIGPTRLWLVEDARSGNLGVKEMIGAAIVSLSHGRKRFALCGPSARHVLARCVALDFDAPNLSPGWAANTALHRVPVTLIRNAPDAFGLFVPRSFAQTVREQIEDTARSVR